MGLLTRCKVLLQEIHTFFALRAKLHVPPVLTSYFLSHTACYHALSAGHDSETFHIKQTLFISHAANSLRTLKLQNCFRASHSNIQILQRFQNKTVRLITNAPWYVPNAVLHMDLQLLTTRAEITRMSGKYKAKLEAHPNDLAQTLCIPHTLGRLSKITPLDLPQRF